MSRWEVLQSNSDTVRRNKKASRLHELGRKQQQPPRQQTSAKWIIRDHDDTRRVDGTGVVGRQDELECLLHTCRGNLNPLDVSNLSSHVMSSVDILSSKAIVCEAARDVLLPFLLKDDADHGSDVGFLRQSQSLAIKAIDALLTSPPTNRNCSALMAPLVDHISVDGAERQSPNPIRQLLFQALQHRLLLLTNSSVTDLGRKDMLSNDVAITVVHCLTHALQMAKAIDGTQLHACHPDKDVTPSVIQRFVSMSLEFEQWQHSSLELWLALLERHPDCASSFTANILLPSPVMHTPPLTSPSSSSKSKLAGLPCQLCGLFASQTFQEILHSITNNDNTLLCMKILIRTIPRLPIQIWMRNERNTTHTLMTFRDQICHGFDNILSIVTCLTRRMESLEAIVVTALVELIETLLLGISVMTDPTIELRVTDLLRILSTIALQPHYSHAFPVRDLFVNLLGGKITPQGQRTPMCCWLQLWLRSKDGSEYVKKLLVPSLNNTQKEESPLRRLVDALLRNIPDVILDDDEVWVMFQSFVTDEKQAHGVHLMEALLCGLDRARFYTSRDVVSFAVPILLCAAEQTTDISRCVAACNSYGSLATHDWRAMLSRADMGLLTHIFRSVLDICSNASLNAKIRSAGCKALGDMSAKCFVETDFGQHHCLVHLLRDIAQALKVSSSDLRASVRCMALFAMGNVAQVVRGCTGLDQLDGSIIVEMSEICLNSMHDPDEKSVANAIRSVGHATVLLMDRNTQQLWTLHGFSAANFARQVMEHLIARVNHVVTLTTVGQAEESTHLKLNWRQRSGIKKHGWGACNTLSLILTHGVMVVDNEPICILAIQALLRCVVHTREMNEKVAIAAMKALLCVNATTLMSLVSKCDILVQAISVLIGILVDSTDNDQQHGSVTMSRRLMAEVELTLHRLLSGLSIQSALSILRTTPPEHVRFLFEWMVRKECPSAFFVPFALSIQTSVVNLDLATEQLVLLKAVDFSEPDDDEF